MDNHDRDQIDRIVNLYGHLIDDREWDRLGEVFAGNGSFIIGELGVSCHGLADIIAHMRSATHPLAHFHTNTVIDVHDGADRATARVNVWGPWPDGTAVIGKYHDELIRTADGWRFLRRDVRLIARRWPEQPAS